jgi:hypothetical protein
LTSGKTLAETLPAWQREIANEARTQDYKVVDQ